VEDDVDAVEQGVERRVAQVGLDDFDVATRCDGCEVRSLPVDGVVVGEAVDRANSVASTSERLGEVRADEPGRTGHEYVHADVCSTGRVTSKTL
jgi:hypothetical protein